MKNDFQLQHMSAILHGKALRTSDEYFVLGSNGLKGGIGLIIWIDRKFGSQLLLCEFAFLYKFCQLDCDWELCQEPC